MSVFTQSDLDRLEAGVSMARRAGAAKLLARPFHLGQSKILEVKARRSGRPIFAVGRTFWNEPFHVAFPERVSMTVFRYGFFEEELTRAFLQIVKPGMTFFDVGAHFGYFSLLAAKLVGPAGRVHAFEPTPSTFEMLRRNVAGRPNISAVNAAAYASDSTLVFHDYGVEFSAFNSIGDSKLAPSERERAQARTVEIRARSLDRYCEETGVRPDILKIDAEGAEAQILAGMKGLLADARPMLTLEMGDPGDGDPARPGPSREVVDLIVSMGYKGLEYRDGKFVDHTPRARYEYTNLLFVPVQPGPA